MRKITDDVTDSDGNAIEGATVTFLSYPAGAAVVIYSDDGVTPIPGSVVTTAADGSFSCYVPEGRYNRQVRIGGVLKETDLDFPVDAGPGGIVELTGTAHTVTIAHNGKILRCTNAAAITLTLPQTSTEAIALPFMVGIIQGGAGRVTVAKQGSDTIESSGSLVKLFGQHSFAVVTKRTAGSPNNYVLWGDLVA